MDEMEEKFVHIANEILTILNEKHKKYGTKNLEEYGLLGIIIRMNDKIQRLENQLSLNDVEKQKSIIKDQLIDLQGYSINGLRILNETKNEFFHKFKMGRKFEDYVIIKRGEKNDIENKINFSDNNTK